MKLSRKAHLQNFILVLFVIFAAQASFYLAGKDMLADVLSSVLVLETNQFRAVNIEKELVVNDLLMKGAQMKADDMAAKGYFSHIGPAGEAPWTWFAKAGYSYSHAGENLAVDYTESSDVTQGWINSATHRANLLNQNFTEIGIGIAKGMYEGHLTTFVVQFFGTPLAIAPVQVVEKPVGVVQVKPAVKALKAVAPETAIATVPSLPTGEVLGTEAEKVPPVENDHIVLKMFLLIVLILVLSLIIKILTRIFRRQKLA
jgi:uncharacterized protein YkwD